jgi:hypothetical protein
MKNIDMRHMLTEQKVIADKEDLKVFGGLIVMVVAITILASLTIQSFCSGSNVCM